MSHGDSTQDAGISWNLFDDMSRGKQRSSLRAFAQDESESDKVLRERATTLAQPANFTDLDSHSTGKQQVRFRCGTSHYSLELSAMREIRKVDRTAQVPCTPRYILGLIQVHGAITPVIDLVEFFGLRRPENLVFPLMIIVLEVKDYHLGLAVDDIEEVHSLSTSDIKPFPVAVGTVEREIARGVTADRTVVLNPDALIHHPRLRASDA